MVFAESMGEAVEWHRARSWWQGLTYGWGDGEAMEGASAAVLDGGDGTPMYYGDQHRVLQHQGH
jgi:hypothetical protein